jgi:diamine N-acetyltransferase
MTIKKYINFAQNFYNIMDTITLRAVEQEDIAKLYIYENDMDSLSVGIAKRFLPLCTIEEYVLSIQNADITKTEQLRLMIDLNNTTIGCIDLYDMDFINQKSAIGIYLAKEYRGNGFAKQALQKLEDYAYNILSMHQLYAFVSEPNKASNNLFLSCDYALTATLKDYIKYRNKYYNVNFYQKIFD